MEVEQLSPVKTDVENSTSKFKERIAQVTELFKGKDVQVPQHEPHHFSVATTASSTTEGASDTSGSSVSASSSLTSSGFVDISGHRSLEIGNNCYILPTMSVPNNHLQTWELEIESRLDDDLRQLLQTERCPGPLEFWMVRYKGRIGPCILVVCWDDESCVNEKGREIVRKKLQRKIRKLQSMRDCPFPCRVVIDRLRLLALTSSLSANAVVNNEMENASMTDAHISTYNPSRSLARIALERTAPLITLKQTPIVVDAQNPETQATSVGSVIWNATHPNQTCTLGGLISIGDKIYGLTVAHPFAPDEPENEVRHMDFNTPSTDFNNSDESDSDESIFDEFNSDRISIMFENQGPTRPELSSEITAPTVASIPVSPTSAEAATATASESAISGNPECGVISPFGTIFATSFASTSSGSSDESNLQYDWALIAVNDELPLLQNSYVSPVSLKTVEINGFLPDQCAPGLEVCVLGGRSGIQEGRVGQGNIRLRVQGRNFFVTQIVLTKLLGKCITTKQLAFRVLIVTEPGDSGSWVVHGDKVVGCVVAGREILPTAYMIGIGDIFGDIASATGENQVRICANDIIAQKNAAWKGNNASRGHGYQVNQWNSTPTALEGRHEDPLDNYASPKIGRGRWHSPLLASSEPSNRPGAGQKHSLRNFVMSEKAITSRDQNTTDAILPHHYTCAATNLCSTLAGESKLKGLESSSWDWYLAYLRERSESSWCDIILPVLSRGLWARDRGGLAIATVVFETMEQIAILMQTLGGISIFEIVRELEKRSLFKEEVRPLAGQVVFHMIGWMTGLWDPASDPTAKRLWLRKRTRQARRLGSAYKLAIRNSSVDSSAADLSLHVLLARFGKLIPAPELAWGDDLGGCIESGREYVIATFVSLCALKTIAGFEIEWTNTLAQHLEYETNRRVLHVFSHPSICLTLYRGQDNSVISKLYEEQRDELSEESYKFLTTWSPKIGIEDYLVEVILSYRLIFGHDRRSRAAVGEELKRMNIADHGPPDPLLEILCTRNRHSAEIKELHSLLESREFETYIALEEFPFLGRRLVDLQRISMIQRPNSLTRLWRDRRNVNAWFTVWAVVLIGGLTLVFQLLQLVFQIYSV